METETTRDPYLVLYDFMKEVDEYPGDWCMSHALECDHCGRVPMALRLVHYMWSVKWEFRGQIIGLCPQ